MGFKWGYELGNVELDCIGTAAILKGFKDLWLMALVGDELKRERANSKPRYDDVRATVRESLPWDAEVIVERNIQTNVNRFVTHGKNQKKHSLFGETLPR
jgi:hypothetical protein